MNILKKLRGDATNYILQEVFNKQTAQKKTLESKHLRTQCLGGKWYTRFREKAFLKIYKTTVLKIGVKASTRSNQEIKC